MPTLDPADRPDRGAAWLAYLPGICAAIAAGAAAVLANWKNAPDTVVGVLTVVGGVAGAVGGALAAWYKLIKPKVTPVDDPATTIHDRAGREVLIPLIPDPRAAAEVRSGEGAFFAREPDDPFPDDDPLREQRDRPR